MDDELRAALDKFNQECQEAALADPVRPRRGGVARWPLVNLALACLPDQVEEFNRYNEAHGVNARHRQDGMCIIHDEADYKRLRRLKGVRDKDSYSE